MRKALLIAALAAALAPLPPASAAGVETITITGPTVLTGASQPLSCTGLDNPGLCDKATAAVVARCHFLRSGGNDGGTNPNNARHGDSQSGRTGTLGYIFRVNRNLVDGLQADDSNFHEEDNKILKVRVTNKTAGNVRGDADLPDVDISFYARLGDCPSDTTVANGTAAQTIVPLGRTPITFENRIHTKGSYNYWGDEGYDYVAKFPGGWYDDPDDPTKRVRANKYFGVVTIIGGGNATIEVICQGHALNQGPCDTSSANWFEQIAPA